jgi:peptidoglycan hydrolase-like amidase
VLFYEKGVCDTRYGKCCGGVTEDFRVAWSDDAVPYLVPVFDGPADGMPHPPLTEEEAVRQYIENPPDVYCNCMDERILDEILTSRDRQTRDFFRWRTVLEARRATELFREKVGIDLGRILALEPVERGLSGRLKRLRWVGEKGSMVIGKELEIRRVLSSTHLYSSALVIDIEGSARRPDAFVLSGAGWGHGVGLCQIGAAVMAWQGLGHADILKHYYPGTTVEHLYD